MSYRDVYIAEETQEQQLQERWDQADAWRLARQLRPKRQGWVSRHVIHLLHRVGRRLIAIGAEPEQVNLAQTKMVRGQS